MQIQWIDGIACGLSQPPIDKLVSLVFRHTRLTRFDQSLRAGSGKQLARQVDQASSSAPLSLNPLIVQFNRAHDSLQRYLDELPTQDEDIPPSMSCPLMLLVEDNASARDRVRLELEERYHLLEALNGHEALKLIDHQTIDLAIVDLNLGPTRPDSPSGFHLLARLKNRIPTIVLTVDQRLQSIQKAVAAGACGYVVKSADLTNLQAAIEIALSRSNSADLRSEAKILDLATGWLMATYKLTQEAAYSVMMGLAAEKRCHAVDIAKEILDSHQLHANLGRFIVDYLRVSVERDN